ncbi:MAG: SufD family Fe-S cluster assembly protein [Anaerolineae bacterium]
MSQRRLHSMGAMAAQEPAWKREYEAMLRAYAAAGGDPSRLQSPRIASLIVSANQVIGKHELPGIHMSAESLEDGIRAEIVVDPGTRFDQPVHLCFGMLPEEGVQRIIGRFEIGAGAHVAFLAHCTFPNARRLSHLMDAEIHVGEGATFNYEEAHYHGPYGGIEVVPHARLFVDRGARYLGTFSLVQGRVGRLKINYEATVAERGVVELVAKAYGTGDDDIEVQEVIHLNGPYARGLTKTRIAVRHRAHSKVHTVAEGNAPFTRGHMDCTEIVQDEAIAENMPVVVVRDDQAHVTHEASIGSVNRKELETLMARGLDEEQAVDVIIRGMLG